jgi:hypothetical protein
MIILSYSHYIICCPFFLFFDSYVRCHRALGCDLALSMQTGTALVAVRSLRAETEIF